MKSRRNVRIRNNRKSRIYKGGIFGFTNSGKTNKQNRENWEKYWQNTGPGTQWNDKIDWPGMTNFGFKKPVALTKPLLGPLIKY